MSDDKKSSLMTEKNYSFYKREFLNLPGYHSSGHIIAEITKGSNLNASLRISDCSRNIDLDFDIYVYGNTKEEIKIRRDLEEIENVNHKIDLIYDTVKEFRKRIKKKTSYLKSKTEKNLKKTEDRR